MVLRCVVAVTPLAIVVASVVFCFCIFAAAVFVVVVMRFLLPLLFSLYLSSMLLHLFLLCDTTNRSHFMAMEILRISQLLCKMTVNFTNASVNWASPKILHSIAKQLIKKQN